ncbi:hypothetical protein U9M48_000909 [Paspalum notatum var. saurae]|uniref:Dirigent protein n=1 Tax=Paspalum notatum var. saurae TaxID=547442 RepID=A0AAQ3PMJ7_PASNO
MQHGLANDDTSPPRPPPPGLDDATVDRCRPQRRGADAHPAVRARDVPGPERDGDNGAAVAAGRGHLDGREHGRGGRRDLLRPRPVVVGTSLEQGKGFLSAVSLLFTAGEYASSTLSVEGPILGFTGTIERAVVVGTGSRRGTCCGR